MTKKTFIGNASFLGILTVLGIVLMVLRQTLPQDPSTPLFYSYFVAPIMLYFGIAGLVGLLIVRNTGFSLTKTVAVVLRMLAAIFFVLPFFFFLIVVLPWALLRGLFAILMVVMLYAPWFWLFFGLFYGLSWAQQKIIEDVTADPFAEDAVAQKTTGEKTGVVDTDTANEDAAN
mgnify:CR=1 FL=1